MDISIRILSVKINYRQWQMYLPSVLFSVVWILFIVLIVKSVHKKTLGRLLYSLIFFIFFLIFFTHIVYYQYTGYFFSFNLLKSASEAKSYIWDTVKNSDPITYLLGISVMLFGVLALVMFPDSEKISKKSFFKTLFAFFIVHLLIPVFYGLPNKMLEWDTWRNPQNIYSSFSDANKCIKICGLYEYTVRDFYVNALKGNSEDNPSESELVFLNEEYDLETLSSKNEYTGIFKGKNVIILQLEGIDSWLLNKNDMPNLYKMLNNSIVFDDHYSFYTGGGSTFNSELAVNTGFLTPFTYCENPYSFHNNLFPYSLPKMLETEGYVSNCFHMNSGEFYLRNLNYNNWGYENYYGLTDIEKYSDSSYMLDRELILNDYFNDKLFKSEQPFLDYIITYTVHTPFTKENKINTAFATKSENDIQNFNKMDEEDFARYYASETDYMVGLLLEALENNGLIDNTVIVAVTDHYLYTLNDKTILDKYKNTSNNLINQTPFFIWSNGMDSLHIDKTNSQIDILPTLLNMLGIEYCDDYYIGRDIMDEDYVGYVFFGDYSWYDGENYVELGKAVSSTSPLEEYINKINNEINEKIQKNDLTLKYNYFEKMQKKF